MAGGKKKPEQTEEQTFGRLLKSLRTEKGFDLETVSSETKIAVSTLRLLEAEAYDKLPDTVFVKGFLKSYCQMVDASPDRIIQTFLAGRHHHEETLRYEAGLAKKKRPILPAFAVVLGVLICILYVAISGIKAPAPGSLSETETPANTKDASGTNSAPSPVNQADSETAHLLEINAVEETWLKIIVDRQDPKEYLLNPGDRLELRASSGFNLLLGNATGVHLLLNKESIAISGKHGQVVTLKLP